MWLAVMMVCVGPDIACYPGWTGSNVFKTEETCKKVVVESLAERVVSQTLAGNEVVYIDGQCVFFNFAIPEGDKI